MMRSLKENTITVAASEKLSPEERSGKIVRGVLRNVDRADAEYTVLYDRVIQQARPAAKVEQPAAGGV